MDITGWTPRELLKRSGGGHALNGILYTKTDGIITLPQQTIQCPSDVEFVGSTLDFKEETLDLDSKKQYETFNSLLDSFGIKTAAELALKGATILDKILPFGVNTSKNYDRDKNFESQQEGGVKLHFLAHIKYGIFPKAAIKIKPTSLKLEDDVVSDLRELENEVKFCFEVETIRKKSEQFLRNHGSHITTGIINFGGVYQTRATHETESDCTKSYIQSNLRRAVKLELSGSFSLYEVLKMSGMVDGSAEEKTKFTEKMDDQKEIIHMSKMHSGGSRTAADMDDWKKDIANNQTWAIIDRGMDLQRDFKGIWDILQNQKECFEYPKGLGLLLRYTWHRMNDEIFLFEINDETAASELAKMIIQTIVQKLKISLTENDNRKMAKYLTQLQTRFDWLGECLCKYTHAYDVISDATIELQVITEQTEVPEMQELCSRMEYRLKPDYTFVKKETFGLLSDLHKNKWSFEKSATFTDEPSSIKLIGTCLYISTGENGVHVYDLDLNYVTKIPPREIGAVVDVAEVAVGEMVVAGITGLYLIQRNGTELSRLAYGHHWGVYVHNNFVYTAKLEVKSSAVEVYEYNKGTFQKRHSIGLPCQDQHIITVYVTDNLIYASCVEDHVIYMLSHDGKLVEKCGKEAKVKRLRICHGDREGSVLVADAENDRLQVLDKDKNWFCVDLNYDIPVTKGAVFVKNKLYVIHNAFPKEALAVFVRE